MAPQETDGVRLDAGRRRLDAVRAQMDAHELDLLLVFGSGRHHFIGPNLCWWLSGVRQLGRDAVVALPRDGEPVLLTAPSWDAERCRRRGWIADVAAVDDLPAALGGLVALRGWRGLVTGVAGADTVSAGTADALADALAADPRPSDDLVVAEARLHDAWSLGLIERAVEIAEAGYEHLLETVHPGMAEYEMAAEADAHMRALGADDNFLLVSAAQHNRAVHPPTDREFALGDVVLGEISPSVEGQFAQICRSFVIGEPEERQLDAYAVLRDAYCAGLAAAGPGVPVAEVTRAVDQVVIAAGYGDYTRPPYMRTRGHSMGLGPLVPTDITHDSDVVLEAGMAFVLHPNQYVPGAGYLLCGDEVVITADGARGLSSRLPELDSIAGAVMA
jgi:Xaa-Pro aminopeptidase